MNDLFSLFAYIENSYKEKLSIFTVSHQRTYVGTEFYFINHTFYFYFTI